MIRGRRFNATRTRAKSIWGEFATALGACTRFSVLLPLAIGIAALISSWTGLSNYLDQGIVSVFSEFPSICNRAVGFTFVLTHVTPFFLAATFLLPKDYQIVGFIGTAGVTYMQANIHPIAAASFFFIILIVTRTRDKILQVAAVAVAAGAAIAGYELPALTPIDVYSAAYACPATPTSAPLVGAPGGTVTLTTTTTTAAPQAYPDPNTLPALATNTQGWFPTMFNLGFTTATYTCNSDADCYQGSTCHDSGCYAPCNAGSCGAGLYNYCGPSLGLNTAPWNNLCVSGSYGTALNDHYADFDASASVARSAPTVNYYPPCAVIRTLATILQRRGLKTPPKYLTLKCDNSTEVPHFAIASEVLQLPVVKPNLNIDYPKPENIAL